MKNTFRNVDEYIRAKPPAFREKLEEIRRLILAVCPQAEESLGYGVPCYKYIYMLVAMGVTKTHVSLYGMSTALAKGLAKYVKDHKLSGSTLHFDPQKKLPVTLIKKIVRARMAENEKRAALKKKTVKTKSL